MSAKLKGCGTISFSGSYACLSFFQTCLCRAAMVASRAARGVKGGGKTSQGSEIISTGEGEAPYGCCCRKTGTVYLLFWFYELTQLDLQGFLLVGL